MNATQANRPLAVSSPFDDDTLIVTDVQWNERLGEPFEGILQLISEQGDLEAKDLLGQPLSVRVGLSDEAPTYLNGLCASFSQVSPRSGFFAYEAVVIPWFAMLQHVGGSRIFQEQTAVEIFKQVASERGFSALIDDRLTGQYPLRPYCVQYNESDFHFLSRLLEEEGIYYFFQYSEAGHQLVLADNISAHQTVSGYETLPYFEQGSPALPPAVFDWKLGQRFVTASYVLRDYDFQQPLVDMTVRQYAAETPSPWAWYHFPGRYFDAEVGQNYARVRSESELANQAWISARTSVSSLRSGNTVTVTQHPNHDTDQEYLIAGFSINLSASIMAAADRVTPSFDNQLALHPSSVPFRSLVKTPRPIARGPQIATVVGPQNQEIWTDNFGRIKVQFAWDLNSTGDDASSCWIRVTQPWTGKGYGAVSIPRIGEEVIVGFIDGDIDRPVVIGRLHNADRMPPEELSAAQAKTIFRTRSTTQGDLDAFHELTFDDTTGSESILLHSERDFVREVENNDSLQVGFDKSDPGDQEIKIYNDQRVEIGVGSGGGSQQIKIGQDRQVTIQNGDDTLTIQSGNHSVTASQGTVTIEAQSGITLKCGSSSIEITPAGITIKSTAITGSADADLQLAGNASTTVKAGGNLVIQGALVQIN